MFPHFSLKIILIYGMNGLPENSKEMMYGKKLSGMGIRLGVLFCH